ncbi:MAG: response regulator [Cytophagaceae bacterium]|nr:MAG: response regulator [Cytophagaceae bacterium]
MLALVIDDSSTMRRVHQKGLEKLGYRVCVAADGIDGLRVLSENTDAVLILTDIHMPNMDGIEFTREVRKLAYGVAIRVLVVTSDGTLDVIESAITAGADDVLIKPFTPQDFAEKVKMVVNA